MSKLDTITHRPQIKKKGKSTNTKPTPPHNLHEIHTTLKTINASLTNLKNNTHTNDTTQTEATKPPPANIDATIADTASSISTKQNKPSSTPTNAHNTPKRNQPDTHHQDPYSP